MLAKLRAFIRRALSRKSDNGHREQLNEARTNLLNETAKLERDVQRIGRRSDPIDAIIHNIKRASGR